MTKPPEIRAPELSGSRSRGIFSAGLFKASTLTTDGFVANHLNSNRQLPEHLQCYFFEERKH